MFSSAGSISRPSALKQVRVLILGKYVLPLAMNTIYKLCHAFSAFVVSMQVKDHFFIIDSISQF